MIRFIPAALFAVTAGLSMAADHNWVEALGWVAASVLAIALAVSRP
ncbi:MAG: hypothetical protein JF588_19265 [Caulobacterales bacterium]|nr:hypothetical protein [Caulobacterales bacterium]